MKKFLFVLLTVSVLFFNPSYASAVWSNWQTEAFGHTARIFTDDTHYYSGASTIDWKAEKKGSRTIYYTAGIYKKKTGGGLVDTNLVHRGYFKSSTPLKSFDLKKIRQRTGSGTYVIQIDCYSDSKKKDYIGTFESVQLIVK
ncbi:hypothetical protein KLEB273_gp126 [Bacillus phage vB_BauM_KLEB27-3]|nr:hypothetical protein KLEB273_gp126 [Bacillus phage vB_BauM_KLEB27-3]